MYLLTWSGARRILAGSLLLVLVTACSGGGGTASSPGTASPSGVTAPSPSAVEPSPTSSSPPSATAGSTAEPSVAANCMDAATADLLVKNITKLDQLTPAQLSAIVAALKAMVDPATAAWRQQLVADIEAKDWSSAGLAAMSIVSGQIDLKKCP